MLALSTLKAFATVGSNKPLLGTDLTQPVSRTISGVPLYSSPAVAADVVWAIPAQHVHLRGQDRRDRGLRLFGHVHERQGCDPLHDASVVRIHPADGDHENHEGLEMVKRQVLKLSCRTATPMGSGGTRSKVSKSTWILTTSMSSTA